MLSSKLILWIYIRTPFHSKEALTFNINFSKNENNGFYSELSLTFIALNRKVKPDPLDSNTKVFLSSFSTLYKLHSLKF